jgi:hypothetical protein
VINEEIKEHQYNKDMQPIDTVEQTIEKLMTTIKHLHDLADKAINNVDSAACQSVCRKELDEIMEKHYNQY